MLQRVTALNALALALFGPASGAGIDLYEKKRGGGQKWVTPLPCTARYLTDGNRQPHCMEPIRLEGILTAERIWCGAG